MDKNVGMTRSNKFYDVTGMYMGGHKYLTDDEQQGQWCRTIDLAW